MKLGILGGTFDPPHLGHLIAAQDAIVTLGLDRVVFVPAARPPHKRGQAITDGAIRLELVRAAIAGDDRFDVDDLELRRSGPSYTVDTLRTFTRDRPAARLFLLLGADQFAELDSWHESAEVQRLATLAVLSRAGDGPERLPAGGEARVMPVAVTRVDISSTDIRRRVAAAEPIRYLVPAAVERIIHERALYAVAAQ